MWRQHCQVNNENVVSENPGGTNGLMCANKPFLYCLCFDTANRLSTGPTSSSLVNQYPGVHSSSSTVTSWSVHAVAAAVTAQHCPSVVVCF